MAIFLLTNNLMPEGQRGHQVQMLDSYGAFDSVVLGLCGGGVNEESTAAAMQLRRTLMDLKVGEKYRQARVDNGVTFGDVTFTKIED